MLFQFFFLAGAVSGSTLPTMPPGPPQHLPQVFGSEYPPFRVVFRNGECDADDDTAHRRINTNKVCYSCFRIPSLVRNPMTGTIFAFAEARRRELHGVFHGMVYDASSRCPDMPDTNIAFKRSTDGGQSWSELRILARVPGRYSAQASPVVDNVTGMIIVAYNIDPYNIHKAMLINSSDDGQTWSFPRPMVPAQGSNRIILSTNGARGHVLYSGSGIRLVFPSRLGSLYSDDHGSTWTVGPQADLGEAQIAQCSSGACGGNNFALLSRGPGRSQPCVFVRFSSDAVHWGQREGLNLSRYSEYPQAPGALGVPGALLMTHGGGDGTSLLHGTSSSDVGHGDGNGMDLLWSKDGRTWQLLRRLWPFTGGYSTMSELEVDSTGAVKSYAVLFEAGGLTEDLDLLAFQNFTWEGAPTESEALPPQASPSGHSVSI